MLTKNAAISLVIIDVDQEMKRQDQKWGADHPNTPETWHCILSEETGEVAEATLDLRPARQSQDPAVVRVVSKHLYEELVQVAAVAIQHAAQIKQEIIHRENLSA